VLFQRGALAVSLGKMDEARGQLNQALELARALDNQPQQIKTMLQLVYVLQNNGESEAAQKLASEALTIAQNKGMQTLVARGLVDLGTVFFVTKNYSEAEKYFKQALEYSQRYKAPRSEARAQLMFGNLRITQGQIDEGVGYAEKARDFYKQNGFRLEASRAITLLARANRSKGNYEAALQAFQDLLVLAEQANDEPQKVLSHEGIASVQVRQASYLEALDHFRANYTINKALNNLPGTRNSLLNQAYILGQLGYYEDAGAKLAEALPVAEQAKKENKSLFSEYLSREAEIALYEGKLGEAKGKAEAAIDLLGSEPSSTLVDAKLALGMTQILSGEKREARLSSDAALQLATQLGDPWIVSRARALLALAMLENGDTNGALTNALQAQEHFGRSGQLDWEWRTLVIAARAARRSGDVMKAREYAGNANNALTDLQKKWGAEAFNSYLKRADVQTSQKQLREEVANGS